MNVYNLPISSGETEVSEGVYPEQVQKAIGKVTWFDTKKGYGFIRYNDKDFFVHHNQIIGKGFQILQEGQRVRFKPDIGERGGLAKNVEKVG